MDKNQNKNAAFQAKMEELYPRKGKRQRSYLRSLMLMFVIVIIAATISDLRRPKADQAQAAFTDLVYRQMEEQRADFWLGTYTAKELLSQDGWIIGADSDPDIRRTAATLLGLPHGSFNDAPMLSWSGLKAQEAARLWDLWQTQTEGLSELDFIKSQLALQQQSKTLPGIGEDIWMINDLYLLAVDGDAVGICLLNDLKHLD